MKKLLNETIIYGIGAIMPRVILFILNPLYINQIENKDFAIFSNLYALISFVNILLSFGFETAFFRFSAEKDNEKKTFNTSFWFLLGLSTLFLLVCLIFSQPIADRLEYSSNPEYIRWFAWIAFFDNLCVIPFAWLRYNNKPIRYSLVRVLQSLFQTVLTIALFLYIPLSVSQSFGLKEKVSFPFYSNLAASGLGLILLLPVVLKVQFQFSGELFKRMIKYSWPVMIAGLAFMVNENFDKAVQIWYIPNEDAGAYGGCYKLAVLMTLFVTAYRMGIEPFFFKQMNNENAKNTYAKVTEYFTFFAATVAMGIIANISWLKQILIPNNTYWTAIDIIPVIVVANLCFGIYYNFSTWYKVTDKTKIGTVISWLGAGLTIVLNLLFLTRYGFMVSAWVTFIAYFVMMITSYLLGQKYYPIPYRIGKMAFFIGLLMAFSFIIVYFFNYNFWIGNLLFLIYTAVLVYTEKDMLMSRVRKN